MPRRTRRVAIRLSPLAATLILFSLACSGLTGAPADPIESAQGSVRTSAAGQATVRAITRSAEGGLALTDRPAPSEKPEALAVVKQGYSQDGGRVSYGLLVRNPNRELAVERATYLAAAYDSDGVVMDTSTGYIDMILPGQTLGFIGELSLKEGQVAARLEFQFDNVEYALPSMDAPITAEKISFEISPNYSKATGLLVNPNDKIYFMPGVTAIAYDASGEIIGGGTGYVNFIPAKGSTGVQVSLSLPKTVRVEAVELYAMVSGVDYQNQPEVPDGALPVSIDKTGFGQADRTVGFGMILQNPNAGLVIRQSQYNLTFFDAGGYVITTAGGELDVLLPNQILGFAGSAYVGDGVAVDRILFQVNPGEYSIMDALPFFSYEKVQFLPDSFAPKVSGVILNPFDKDFTNLMVSAIGYDDSGAIIGGGYGFLEFLPSKGKAAVEVMVTTAGNPAAVELCVLLHSTDILP